MIPIKIGSKEFVLAPHIFFWTLFGAACHVTGIIILCLWWSWRAALVGLCFAMSNLSYRMLKK